MLKKAAEVCNGIALTRAFEPSPPDFSGPWLRIEKKPPEALRLLTAFGVQTLSMANAVNHSHSMVPGGFEVMS